MVDQALARKRRKGWRAVNGQRGSTGFIPRKQGPSVVRLARSPVPCAWGLSLTARLGTNRGPRVGKAYYSTECGLKYLGHALSYFNSRQPETEKLGGAGRAKFPDVRPRVRKIWRRGWQQIKFEHRIEYR